MDNELDKLYRAVSSKMNIGDSASFSLKMDTPEKRKSFYDKIQEKGFSLGDYDTFESRLKKKVQSEGSTNPASQPTIPLSQNGTTKVAPPVIDKADVIYQSGTPSVEEVQKAYSSGTDNDYNVESTTSKFTKPLDNEEKIADYSKEKSRVISTIKNYNKEIAQSKILLEQDPTQTILQDATYKPQINPDLKRLVEKKQLTLENTQKAFKSEYLEENPDVYNDLNSDSEEKQKAATQKIYDSWIGQGEVLTGKEKKEVADTEMEQAYDYVVSGFEKMLDSFKEGMDERDYNKYITTTLAQASDEERKIVLEKEYQDYLYKSQLIQEPQDDLLSVGGVSKMVGTQAVPIVAGVGLSLIPPIGKAASMMYSTVEAAETSYGAALVGTYIQARNEGKDVDKALSDASDVAKVNAVTGGLEGLAGAYNPKGLSKFIKPSGFLPKALRPFVQKAAIGGVDLTLDAGVAAVGQIINNAAAINKGLDTDLFDGVSDEMLGEVIFSAGMGIPKSVTTIADFNKHIRAMPPKEQQKILDKIISSKDKIDNKILTDKTKNYLDLRGQQALDNEDAATTDLLSSNPKEVIANDIKKSETIRDSFKDDADKNVIQQDIDALKLMQGADFDKIQSKTVVKEDGVEATVTDKEFENNINDPEFIAKVANGEIDVKLDNNPELANKLADKVDEYNDIKEIEDLLVKPDDSNDAMVDTDEFVVNKTTELQSLPDEDYINEFIDYGHLNSINDNREFLFRPDFKLPTKEVQKGIQDIKDGKETAAARKLKEAILETKQTGFIPIIEGTGGTSIKTNRELGSLYNQDDITDNDKAVYDNLSQNAKSAIDEGITLDNIDALKEEYFSGFPYTEEDFNNIKKELENERARTETPNSEAKGISDESESKSKSITPRGEEQSNISKGDISNSRNEEETNELRSRIREAQETAKTSSTDGGGAYDEKNTENVEVLKFAKDKGVWIDDMDSLGEHMIGGNEHTLSVNKESKKVYKSNNLSNTGSLDLFFNKIKLHNKYFPETTYDFVGFTGLENKNSGKPYVEPVYSQDFIVEAENASPKEISDYMEGKGFEQIDEFRFKNKDVEIFDVRPRNVLKDKSGNIYVIDAEFKELNNDNTLDTTDKKDITEDRKKELKDKIAKSLKEIGKGGLSSGGLQNIEHLVNIVSAYIELGYLEAKAISKAIKDLMPDIDISENDITKAIVVLDSIKDVDKNIKNGIPVKDAIIEGYNSISEYQTTLTEYRKAFKSYVKEGIEAKKAAKKINDEKIVADIFNDEKKVENEVEKNALAKGIRLGANATKGEIKNVQQQLTDYAKKILPNTKFVKSNFTPILTLIKNTQKAKDVEKAIEKINQLSDKVIYNDRISNINNKKKIIRTNLKKKIGNIAPEVRKILSLKNIPDNLLDEYEGVINNLSLREKILPVDLEAVMNLYDKVVEQLTVEDNSLVDSDVKTDEEIEQESLDKATKSYESVKAELDESVDKFSQDEFAKVIGTEDHLIEDISKIEVKANETSKDKIKKIKAITENLKKIKALDEHHNLTEGMSDSDVDFGSSLTDDTAIQFLNIPLKYLATLPSATIKNITTETINISNGFISNDFALRIVTGYNSNEGANNIYENENIFKRIGGKDYFTVDKIRKLLENKLTTRMGQHIDKYIGAINNTALYENVTSLYSRAIGRKKVKVDKINGEVNSLVRKAIISKIGRLKFKSVLFRDNAEFRINIMNDVFRIERQHQSNSESNKTPSIVPILDLLLKDEGGKDLINAKKNNINFSDKSVKILKEIRASLPIIDGKVDLEALKKQLTKEELDIIDYQDNLYNGELREHAEFAMNQVNGITHEMYEDYTPMPVYQNKDKTDTSKIAERLKQTTINKRLKGGSTQEKTEGVKLVRLGGISNFLKYADDIYSNSILLPAFKQAQGTLDVIKKTGNASSEIAAGVISDTMELNMQRTLNRNSSDVSTQQKILKYLINNVAKKLLISITRVAKDISNFIVATPLIFRSKETIAKAREFNKSGAWNAVINDFGTSQAGRTRGAYSYDVASTDLRQALRQGFSGRKLTRTEGALEFLTHNDLSDFGKEASEVYYKMIDVLMPMQQRQRFLSHFKKIAGQDFDSDAYMNDKSYKAKYKSEIERSMAVADKHVSDLYNSVSSFEQNVKGKDKESTDFWNMVSNFMQSFTFNERTTLLTSGKSIVGRGSMSMGEGWVKSLSLITRLYMYNTLGSILYQTVKNGLPEDEEEFYDQLKVANYLFAGDLTTLLFFGNLPAYMKDALGYGGNQVIKLVYEKITDKDLDKEDYFFRNPSYKGGKDIVKKFGATGEVLITAAELAEHIMDLVDKQNSGEKLTHKDMVELESLRVYYGILATTFGIPFYGDVKMMQTYLNREFDVNRGGSNKKKTVFVVGTN